MRFNQKFQFILLKNSLRFPEQFPKYVPDYAPSLPEHRLETITGNPPLFQAKILQVFSFKEKWQIEQENSDDFAKKL